MRIESYFNSIDGNKKLTQHFRVGEFACKNSDIVLISRELVMILECIREYFGAPIIINSGFRTESHNEKVGGAEHSKHMLGIAADINVKGVPPKKVAAFARKLMPTYGGIGIYDTFVHIDVRDNIANW